MPDFWHGRLSFRRAPQRRRAALDAITDLFRLPVWRSDGRHVLFLRAVADILREVRDLSPPSSVEVLEEYGWVYGDQNDSYEQLDQRLLSSTEGDFCDRPFYFDDSEGYKGLSRALRNDPDDPDGGICQDIRDLCKADRPLGMWPEYPCCVTDDEDELSGSRSRGNQWSD
jgi:hypothetical protein